MRGLKYALRHMLHKRDLFCPLCHSRVHRFNMLAEAYLKQYELSLFPHSIFAFETLNVFAYSCPVCDSSDRVRLYKLYLDQYINSLKSGKKHVLDIAPDMQLRRFLRDTEKVVYRSADLFSQDVDDKVDVMDMGLYKDNTFDMILCSHVLEHVPDDLVAMKELYRVLKPDGKAIVMVPILLTITETDEGPDVASAEEKIARFGQDDHIRLYSKEGFVSRLCQAGFSVSQLGSDFFGSNTFSRHGISERAVLYVVSKS